MIHKYEHKYKSIHTATDGIICFKKNVKNFKENNNLGGIKIENEGDVLIFRNKLYIIYNKNKEIIKYALHGFHSNVETLEEMYKKGINEYEYVKVNKLRESNRRNLQVNKFEKRIATLKGGII